VQIGSADTRVGAKFALFCKIANDQDPTNAVMKLVRLLEEPTDVYKSFLWSFTLFVI